MKNELSVCTRRRAVMDSLAHRFSSRRWPTMMQEQRSPKNTQSATIVLVLRYEVEKSSGEGNIAIFSIHSLTQVENEWLSFLSRVELNLLIPMINGGINEETCFWMTKCSELLIKLVHLILYTFVTEYK